MQDQGTKRIGAKKKKTARNITQVMQAIFKSSGVALRFAWPHQMAGLLGYFSWKSRAKMTEDKYNEMRMGETEVRQNH